MPRSWIWPVAQAWSVSISQNKDSKIFMVLISVQICWRRLLSRVFTRIWVNTNLVTQKITPRDSRTNSILSLAQASSTTTTWTICCLKRCCYRASRADMWFSPPGFPTWANTGTMMSSKTCISQWDGNSSPPRPSSNMICWRKSASVASLVRHARCSCSRSCKRTSEFTSTKSTHSFKTSCQINRWWPKKWSKWCKASWCSRKSQMHEITHKPFDIKLYLRSRFFKNARPDSNLKFILVFLWKSGIFH